MPQDPDKTAKPDLDEIARRALDAMAEEPVPGKIAELADELDAALAARRKTAPKDPA